MSNTLLICKLYITQGIFSSVPQEATFSYILTMLKFLFLGFIISYYFTNDYTVIDMALTVLIADFKFFYDYFSFIIDNYEELLAEEQEEDYDE